MIPPPPLSIWEPVLRNALAEDLAGAGDLTSNLVVPATAVARGAIVTRQVGVVACLEISCAAFGLVDPGVVVEMLAADGDGMGAGDPLARISGPARGVLAAERVVLNLLAQMSGVATATAAAVRAVAGTGARIVGTRKTVPGLRALQKYAIRCGGGANHRFGLYDAVLIKDNHIGVAGGVTATVAAAREGVGHLVRIEVEVDGMGQLEEALAAGADVVMLDNMSPTKVREGVAMVDGRAVVEVSGGIDLDNVAEYAAAGADILSLGWLTHSAPALDVGLDFEIEG